MGGQAQGQLGFGQQRALHAVGEGHFCGGDEVERLAFAFLAAFAGGKEVGFKFGQLAGAAQGAVVDDVGGVALGVAVF